MKASGLSFFRSWPVVVVVVIPAERVDRGTPQSELIIGDLPHQFGRSFGVFDVGVVSARIQERWNAFRCGLGLALD